MSPLWLPAWWHRGDVPKPVARCAVGRGRQLGMPELAGFWGKALGNRIWQQSGRGGSGWRETLVSPAASRQLSSMRVGGKPGVFVSEEGGKNSERSSSMGNGELPRVGLVRVAGERGGRLGALPSSSSSSSIPGPRAGLFLGLKPELFLAPC